ncbi:hypothetical protein BG005_007382 [Podila minutissima]|nr:hypothetical protein BG005_007382 [Podila minutissima]
MAITTRLCLTLAIALAVVGTFSHNVHAAAAEAAPVPATTEVVDDTFNYEQYQSPPFWPHAQPIDDNNVHIMNDQPGDDAYIPIQNRPGGARGGDFGDHHGRRRRSFEKRVQHSNAKRAVIYHDDAHLDLLQNVEFDAVVSTQVNTDLPEIEFVKRAVVKRALVDDEGEVEEQEEEDEDEGDNHSMYFDESPVELTEGDDEIADIDGEYFSHIFEGHDVDAEADFGNEDDEDDDDDEDEGEGEDGEYDEDEERRLDNEAGLQDWIEEMKSEEYFDLAGHPAGQDDDEEDGEGVRAFDEDEPSPSEEEIFAASW